MNNNNRLNIALHEVYARVIKEVHKTEDKLKDQRQLYQENKTNIHKSLEQKLSSFEKAISTLKQSYKEALNELEINYSKTLANHDTNRQAINKKHKKNVKEINDTLEKKRSLATLKEQKLTNELNQALNKIDHQLNEEETANIKKLEDAKARYQELSTQVDQETELKKETLKNKYDQAIIDINQALNEKQEAFDEEIAKLEEKLSSYEKTAQNQLKTLLKAYDKALKPLDEEIEELKQNQAEERKSLEQHYNTEIIKKQKFQKEKEKLGDNAAVSDYAKEIKKLKKQQTQALEEKDQEHLNQQTPLNDNRKKTVEQYAKNFKELKTEIIKKILNYLNSMIVVRTKKLIETNNHNILLLQEDAKLEYEEKTLAIDHKLQHLNFSQTLEEASLHYSYLLQEAGPKRTLLEHHHKHHYDLEKNELTKAKNYAKQEYETTLKIDQLKERLSLDENDIERKKSEALNTFDRLAIETEHRMQLIRKDDEKEKLLIKHYYLHARNFTALKNQSVKVYQPQFETEIETRKKHYLAIYKRMLEKAEKEHQAIIDEIESVYSKEMAIYQDTAVEIEKDHQTMINEMMTSQALERNKDIEVIELCDPKKDKQKIKKLRKDLALKQETHDQALAIKKRELEQKLAVYKTMIENIKSFRLQSLEEAETLLMHIKDQLHKAIEHTKARSAEDHQAYQQLYYETKHSADLFETFQLQREEDTLAKSNHYMKARIEKEVSLKEEAKQKLDQHLDTINRKLHAKQQAFNEKREDLELNHEEALNTIDRLSKENQESLSSAYENEKRRLEGMQTRAKRDYEANLKSLNNQTNQKKENLFNQKDQAEQHLKEALKNRENEAENYIQERESLKQKDLENLKTHQASIIKKLSENPIEVIDEKAITNIQSVLKGDIDLKNL